MGKETESLAKRERQIMDTLYRCERASAADVQRALPDPPSYSATRALLAVLVKKGIVTYTSEGNRYIYSPREPKKKAGRSAIARVLNTFFNGSPSAALAGLLESAPKQLSSDEFDRLRELLRNAESKSRKRK